ncbi:aldehyde dehydrogenase family protein [Cypionkella sp.]|uniref:aldehyde dehydrogenase family protein n=1 Tax=Cypionkella sp. TaxID=2811411 RepID=UPI00271C5E84|nr:aldehyde dehydrogenase family protein [Cypionkella sp.]MDO8984042.1 aldehyde dehydrogenase family protein [Cypionkella sp.]MDP2049243.1 aldehyde dehydrogenase family protein [Cypionkella sp.]
MAAPTQSDIDRLAAVAVPAGKLLIGGKWLEGEAGETVVLSPINGQKLTTTAAASAGDVARAVAAARASFEAGIWSRMPPAGRKAVLHRLADLIEKNSLELAVLGVRDNGTDIGMALKAEPGSAAGTFRYYAEAIDKVYGQIAPTADNILALIHREPVGVVAAIVPWNFPMMIGAWKIAPALAAGNSIVLKPAETASLTLLKLAELALEAGVPPGVFNVVTGPGRVTGEALALSMDVDVMVFTGSGSTGRRLLEYSARSNLKRCYLELGGKSPNVVFADTVDLAAAAKAAATAIFRNAGQVCVAGSRLLVEASVHDEFVSMLAVSSAKMLVGNPLNLATQIGAVNSDVQLQANLGFVSDAVKEGGEIVLGGKRTLMETGGYYMEPTVVTGVRPEHRLFREEVFGPILAVTPFRDESEALRLANFSDFGLASGVWTSNLSRAHRMVRGIRAGVVHVNTYGGSDNSVPLGGVKQSGNGHDKSLHALDKYTDLKTAWIQL